MVAAIFPPSLATAAPPSAAPTNTHAWKDGSSFGFHDVLDLLNPLQHIPVVSSVYRWLTDDVPGNVSRILGDGLFGGPIGLVTGALSVAVKEETGKDPGEMAIALLTGSDVGESKASAVAAADPAGAPAPAASASASVDAAQPAPAAPPPPTRAATAKPGLARASTGATGAEAGFLAQTSAQSAMLQRSLTGQRAASGHPVTAPIPLQLTGGINFPIPAQRRAAATEAPSAAPAAPAGAAEAGPPANPPTEISRQMLEALDKYMQLRQQRGSTVDLVQ